MNRKLNKIKENLKKRTEKRYANIRRLEVRKGIKEKRW